MPKIDKRLILFFALLGGTVVSSYYVPKFLQVVFYIFLLVAYYRSKHEGVYLALFLTISDGFMGFFNNYEVVLSVIPGLPPVEMGNLFIILALIKAIRSGPAEGFFHDRFLGILAVYTGFLVVQGYVLGLSPELNVQFRMIKFLIPLTLMFSIPRLFRTEEDYRLFFMCVFALSFFALFAQIFTISTGMTPSQYLGVYREFWFTVDVSKGKTYRGFYSTDTVLIAFFGAMYYLGLKAVRPFNIYFLFTVMAACYMSAFLSATRGWLIGLTSATILFLLFVLKLSPKRVISVVLTAGVLIFALMSIPIVEKQFSNTFKRLTTLEALAQGDMTAGGTLERLDKRSPRVMDKWSEAPLTGWGFSDGFFKHGDFHVGNQNILLHSGILGAALMGMFFVFYHGALTIRGISLPPRHPYKESLMAFICFFPGWFAIHSSSGQAFSYYQRPAGGIVIAVYFCLGALAYNLSFNPVYRTNNTSIPPDETL